MERITLARMADYQDLVSLFALSYSDAPSSRPSYILDQLAESIEAGRVYLLRQDRIARGFILISHDIERVFFPDTESFSKMNNLLDDIGHKGERVCIIESIHVDARMKRKGIATTLAKSMYARYKDATWLALVETGNVVARAFFGHLGFHSIDSDVPIERHQGNACVYVKNYRPTGLCREAFW